MTITRIAFVAAAIVVLVPTFSIADEYSDAERAVQAGDYIKGLEHIRFAIARDPQDIDRLRLGAKIYLEMNILDTAVSYAKRVYKDDDDIKQNVLLYADALVASGEADEACVAIRKFRKAADDVEMALAHVDALVAADSMVSAELVATTARSKFSKSPLAYLALGNLYFNWKPRPILENAADNYRAALDIDNNLVNAHFNLAICYWKMRNRESDDALGAEYLTKCLDEWTIVSQLDPKNARAWFEQGKIYYYAKKYTKAVNALKEYRVLRPVGTGEPLASLLLGASLCKLAKFNEAQQHLMDAASQADSLKPKVALMLARCNEEEEPVPDAEITGDMEDFANVDQINRSAAEGGSGEDNGASEGPPHREEEDEPIMDAFEFEDGFLPVTDEADLVKKLRDLYTTTQSFRKGFEGTVLVTYVVGKDGRVSVVKVDPDGSSGYMDLDEAAIKAIRSSVYTPAKHADGQPAACRLQRSVTFRQR